MTNELRTEHDEMVSRLRAANPDELARIDARVPDRAKPNGATATTILKLRAVQLRNALASTAANSTTANKPAVVAHTVTTDQLECLAVEIFGRAALPKIDTMPDPEKRTAIMRELWQAHVTVPGLKIEAQPGWYRVEYLDRVCQTIAAYRQAKVHEFLAVTPPPPAGSAMDRAAFNQLSPRAQSDFCLNGGRITD